MARGAKPGERRGGRTKGAPNKVNRAKAEAIAEINRAQGRPGAVDSLRDGAYRYIALAAPFQKGGLTPDPKQFEHNFDKAMALFKIVAPYETPTLQATTLVGDRDKPITHTLTVKFV